MQLSAALVSLLAFVLLQTRLDSLLTFYSFSGLAVAQRNRYCACQSGTDQSIHESATQRVLDENPNLYAWGKKPVDQYFGC